MNAGKKDRGRHSLSPYELRERDGWQGTAEKKKREPYLDSLKDAISKLILRRSPIDEASIVHVRILTLIYESSQSQQMS